MWATGEQLRVSSDARLAGQLAQGGPAIVNGLQGNPIDLVLPANIPPLRSYFIDFEDRFDDFNARGHVGDVATFRACAPMAVAGPPMPAPMPRPAEPGAPLPWFADFPIEPIGPELPWPDGFLVGTWPELPPPPPPICPIGTHLEQNALRCCPDGQIPGLNGQCQSPCANGSANPADVAACWRGFQPGAAPGPGGPGTCWNGTAPVSLCAPNTFGCKKCPKSPLKQCPAGFDEVIASPANIPNVTWWWSDRTCVPKPAQLGCAGGQQVGLDGVCHNICPAGQTAWPVNRCCFNGTAPNALGQCGPGLIVPPIWYLDYLATGTGPCVPPNCSHYEFTITGRQRFGRGSLTQHITLPPGSDFPAARVTRGSRYCPASAWKCSKTGNGFTCSAEDCGLAPGDQVVLRLEGRAAPELTVPPPAPVERTACGVLEWQAMPGRGPAILEQIRDLGSAPQAPSQPTDGGIRTDRFSRITGKEACWTIRVVPAPIPARTPACPPRYAPTSDGQCCLATQLTTTGQCCAAGQRPDARRLTCETVTPLTPAVPPIIRVPERVRSCPPDQRWDGQRCVPERARPCPPDQRWDGQRCVPERARPCPPDQRWDGQRCVPERVRQCRRTNAGMEDAACRNGCGSARRINAGMDNVACRNGCGSVRRTSGGMEDAAFQNSGRVRAQQECAGTAGAVYPSSGCVLAREVCAGMAGVACRSSGAAPVPEASVGMDNSACLGRDLTSSGPGRRARKPRGHVPGQRSPSARPRDS